MGSIVGAAIVSHHPGLMQCEEFRVLQGAGADSDLIPGYARLRGQTDTNRDGKVDTDLDGANISPDRLNLAADYQTGPWALRLQMQKYMSRNMQRALVKDDFEGYTLVDAFVRYQLPLGADAGHLRQGHHVQPLVRPADPVADRHRCVCRVVTQQLRLHLGDMPGAEVEAE